MNEFKKEAEAIEADLFSLLHDLEKVSAGKDEWDTVDIISFDVEAAKSKIKDSLKKYAASRNGAFKGILGSLFKSVDRGRGSIGEEK